MAEHRAWYKKPAFWAGFFVLLAIVFFASFKNSNADISAVGTQSHTSTDSAAQDSLPSDQVNGERLRKLAESSKDQPVDDTQLASQINSIINANMDVIFGVSIQDLATGAVYNYGSSSAFTAASVTKVLTATDYLKEVELGHKSLSDVMPDGTTAQYSMEQMIVVSDNDAWHYLNDDLGYTQLQSYAESIGLSSYYYGDNVISASDVTKLLNGLYLRQLINEEHTQLLLSYMVRANYRDLVIPAVPQYDTVYHKAGEYAGNLHDATIITNSTDTIVMTIFTQSLYSYNKSRISSLMQQITTPTLQTFQLN